MYNVIVKHEQCMGKIILGIQLNLPNDIIAEFYNEVFVCKLRYWKVVSLKRAAFYLSNDTTHQAKIMFILTFCIN